MAVIKLGQSKNANNSISYAEKRADIRGGFNCDVDISKIQFQATRNIFNKNDGLQCHTIIQSFLPNEVESGVANEIGCLLAERVAKDFEVAVYTHADKEHIHNHIIINSVNFETGIKYQSNKKKLYEIREISDELCLKYGLSIATDKPSQAINYTLAEKELLNKGESSWKDEIRQAIDMLKDICKDYQDFKSRAKKDYGITIDDSRKHIVYYHSDYSKEIKNNNIKKARGKTLGADYTKEAIQDVFKNKIRSNIGGESSKIREFPIESSTSRSQRRKSEIDGNVDFISQTVRSYTRSGREEQNRIRESEHKKAEAERLRIEEQNRAARELELERNKQSKEQQQRIIRSDKSKHEDPSL